MYDEIQSFVNWLRRRNQHARTWRDYGYYLKQFMAVVDVQPPANITLKDIDRFVTAQVAHDFKPATVNRQLAAIMSLYTFLADETPDLVCPILPHRHLLYQPQRFGMCQEF